MPESIPKEMTKQDKQWRAESDAYTLIEAEAIKKDEERFEMAQKEAQKMVKQKQDEAAAAKKVAKMDYEYMPD